MTKKSLLPAHLSELERDLDAALSRIEDTEIPIETLWNPWLCPLEVLPYLAWAVSVDQWKSDWSEKVKRQVTAGSMQVHSQKGTRSAVEMALSDYGIKIELTEWFEATPRAQPGTFELIAWANENLTPNETAFINQELYNQIKASVTSAKNTRSHFTFKVGARFDSKGFGVANALSGIGAVSRRVTHAQQEPLEHKAATGMTLAADGLSVTRNSTALSINATPKPSAVAIGAVCRAWSVIHKRMEATK